MKNTNELRRNNLVYRGEPNDGEPTSVINVISITEDEINFNIYIGELKGIPLTQEFLFEFGFTNKAMHHNKLLLKGDPSGDMDGAIKYSNGQNASIYFLEGKSYYELDYHTDDYGAHITTKEIKYVHKLQNIHYELTGEELKIKSFAK